MIEHDEIEDFSRWTASIFVWNSIRYRS